MSFFDRYENEIVTKIPADAIRAELLRIVDDVFTYPEQQPGHTGGRADPHLLDRIERIVRDAGLNFRSVRREYAKGEFADMNRFHGDIDEQIRNASAAQLRSYLRQARQRLVPQYSGTVARFSALGQHFTASGRYVPGAGRRGSIR